MESVGSVGSVGMKVVRVDPLATTRSIGSVGGLERNQILSQVRFVAARFSPAVHFDLHTRIWTMAYMCREGGQGDRAAGRSGGRAVGCCVAAG